MSWGTELWVSPGEGAPRADPGPRPPRDAGWAGAADRRLQERVRPSAPGRRWGVPLLFVCRPSRPRVERLLVRVPASAAAAGLRAAPGRRGHGPRAPAPAAILSRALSLLRLYFPDAWLRAGPRFSAFVSPRLEAGEGAPLSRRGAVRGRGGGSRRGTPPGRGSPGRGRRRVGAAPGSARRRPPFSLQVGGAGGFVRARPAASRAQPTRPFSPCLRGSDPRSFGSSRLATLAATLAVGVAFWDELN